jgi:hypothetical protein
MGSRKSIYVQAGSAGRIVWDHRIVLQANFLSELSPSSVAGRGGQKATFREADFTGLGSAHRVLAFVDANVKQLYMMDFLHIPFQRYDLNLSNSYGSA